jgi:hypothetical protein
MELSLKFSVAVSRATVPVALAAAATLVSGVAFAATGDRALGRVSGADRFSTAVAISKTAFPNGASVVYLARADTFAEALAGSSLTKDGPVLLVPACAKVPQVVLDEVTRLQPQAVKALGGQSAVCDAVLGQFAGAAGDGSAAQPTETGSAGPAGPQGPAGGITGVVIATARTTDQQTAIALCPAGAIATGGGGSVEAFQSYQSMGRSEPVITGGSPTGWLVASQGSEGGVFTGFVVTAYAVCVPRA